MSGSDDGPRQTLILSRSDLAEVAGLEDYLNAAEAAFKAMAEGAVEAPPPLTLSGAGGSFHGKAGGLRGRNPYVALKLNGNFPANAKRGLPTIQGALLLCDGKTGELLAIMDSAEITLQRTAAATALAARHLARPESATILICGCGAQAGAQLAALAAVLPLRRCLAWDQDQEKARNLALSASSPKFDAAPVRDLSRAVAESDVIVTCTTSRRPFLAADMVRPGTFIAAVGADSPDKSEIEPDLMARATVVADVLAQCAVMGDLHHALEAGALEAGEVHAELHELVSGSKAGRTLDTETTLFDSTGSGIQDVVAASFIFERAQGRTDLRRVRLAA